MTDHQYRAVATAYEHRYGEPLVADAEWVGPLFDTCEVAVACDPAVYCDGPADAENYTVIRTADVIAVITHGLPRLVA